MIVSDIPPPFDKAWVLAIFGLIIGLCFGSFITMLSYRLPRQLSIVLPPSTCPSCQTQLKIRDLIPVISWLLARGKCRHCGTKIGVRYILIEIATGVAVAIAFALIGLQLSLAAGVAAIIAALTALTIRIEGK